MLNNFEKIERLSVDEKSTDTVVFNPKQHQKQAEIRQNLISKHRKIEHDEFINSEKEIDKEFNHLIEDRVTQDNLHEFLNKQFPDNPKAKELATNKLEENNFIDTTINPNGLRNYILNELNEDGKRTAEEEAEILHEQLKQEGKPNTEILQILITTFRSNENLKKWIENWQRFLELSEFAKTKPLQERRAIEKIVSNADCKIRTKADSHSELKRTGIPDESGQPFRLKTDSHSG